MTMTKKMEKAEKPAKVGFFLNANYLAGFCAGAAMGVTRCRDCVYRWDPSREPGAEETSDHEMMCFKHNRMTAANYFCGDARR